MKLHLCCGDVYLTDYINIDIQGYIVSSTQKPLGTTLENYYVNSLNINAPKQDRGNFPIDFRINILEDSPFKDNSTDEIVMIQSIEHFTLTEAKTIISRIYSILKSGGKFLFDFPDILETFNQYNNKEITFENLIRLIYCHSLDDYSSHKWSYSKESFSDLLNECGNWSSIEYKDIVKHDYPAIGGIATK